MARIFHGLEWPYQYRPGCIYLDWFTRRWRLLPVIKKPDPKTLYCNWLDELAEEGDTTTIEQLAERATVALKAAHSHKKKPK